MAANPQQRKPITAAPLTTTTITTNIMIIQEQVVSLSSEASCQPYETILNYTLQKKYLSQKYVNTS
jgi:hypothetical protein